MKKRRIIGAAAALAVLFLLGGCMARPQEQLPVHPQENSAADGLPADSRGDLSAADGSASEQSPEPAGSDAPIRREPEEEEKPAEAPEEDWSVEEAMVRKLRVTFQKQSEGAAELGVGKAMKLFLKSEVKPRDVGAMWEWAAGET